MRTRCTCGREETARSLVPRVSRGGLLAGRRRGRLSCCATFRISGAPRMRRRRFGPFVECRMTQERTEGRVRRYAPCRASHLSSRCRRASRLRRVLDRRGREARSRDVEARFTSVETSIRHADVFDVTFAGHGGDPIKAWLLLPHTVAAEEAMIVEYIGYGGGRGDPLDWLAWSCARISAPDHGLARPGRCLAQRRHERPRRRRPAQQPGLSHKGHRRSPQLLLTRACSSIPSAPSTPSGVIPTSPDCASPRQG